MSRWKKTRRFLNGSEGPTAVEYALLLSLVAAVCVAAARSMAGSAANAFSGAANSISASGSSDYRSDAN